MLSVFFMTSQDSSVLDLLFDFVYELFHLVLFEADAFFAEEFYDFLAGVQAFFRSEEKTNCCAGYGTADNGADYVKGFHIFLFLGFILFSISYNAGAGAVVRAG